jgi:hypothetical protein
MPVGLLRLALTAARFDTSGVEDRGLCRDLAAARCRSSSRRPDRAGDRQQSNVGQFVPWKSGLALKGLPPEKSPPCASDPLRGEPCC